MPIMQNNIVRFWILLSVVFTSIFLFSCKKENVVDNVYDIQYTDTTVVINVKGAVFTMILVEGGTFEMGATEEQGHDDPDENEYPVHVVNLSPYYICQTEVTQDLWTIVMGTNPSLILGDMTLPADCIKWDMCQDFIHALNEYLDNKFEIRMPTEAEWEFAARGGNKSLGYKYSGSDDVDEVAWYESNSDKKTHPVGTKKPNELGIYDMSGNVWEWCDSKYRYFDKERNASLGKDAQMYCIRGGGWQLPEKSCRVSWRGKRLPDLKNSFGGFRLCLDVTYIKDAESTEEEILMKEIEEMEDEE